jgi:hypothetical protein
MTFCTTNERGRIDPPAWHAREAAARMTRPPAPLAMAARSLLVVSALVCSACTTTGGAIDEPEPVLFETVAAPAEGAPRSAPQSPQVSPGVPRPERTAPPAGLEEVIVEAPHERHEIIRNLVAEARLLLQGVELEYVFTGKGRREVLRGRPVAFAAWNETSREWTVIHIEIPRPPLNWTPGRKPFPFRVVTPGVTARHVKGTGAERLMFAFSKDGVPLKVYGRKFPVFDNYLVTKRRWRDVVRTATPIVYLPANEDTVDPQFISDGKEFLLATAQEAIDQLRKANAPSRAYPGALLADIVPARVIAALAVIEQTDDADYKARGAVAFDSVLSQYGLKRGDAYRYSVSRARALGPMQFTDRRGRGTYSMVVRLCPAARIDPSFERGATNLLNAMKAAICLFDIELYQMRSEIRAAYRGNPEVLGIFPVAAYNGGPRNVARLYSVMQRMGVQPADLRAPGDPQAWTSVTCPCLWTEDFGVLRPMTIPPYNNENRGYVQKYQSLMRRLQ